MKRFLIFVGFFASFFLFKSAFANEIKATAPNVNIQALFTNQSGGIPVTVTITAKDNLGAAQSPLTPPQISTGSTGTYFYSATLPSDASPSISWVTSCRSATGVSPTGSSVNAGVTTYTFADQDVHCTNTNSTISVTATSCDTTNNGSVSWSVNNPGTGGANIGTFKVFKALVTVSNPNPSPDSDTNPTVVPATTYTVTGGATYPALAGLSPGTWNIAVKAYPPNYSPNGDNGISVDSSHSFTCGVGLTRPTNLNSNVTCGFFAYKVDYSWTGASPGIFNYVVQTKLGSDPGYNSADALWDGPPATPNPTTNAYVSGTVPAPPIFTQATYYWRVKASPPSGPAMYSSSATFTTPLYCNPITTVVSPNITGVKNCYDLTTNTPSPPDPDKVRVDWTVASSSGGHTVLQDFVDYGRDSTFAPGAYTSIAGGGSVIITDAFVNDQTYYFRIRTQMSDSNWYFSQTAAVVTSGYCPPADYSYPYLTGYTDCQYGSGYPRIHLQWGSVAGDNDHEFWLYSNGIKIVHGVGYFNYDYTYNGSPGSGGQWQVVVDGDLPWPYYNPGIYSNFVDINYPICSTPPAPINLSASPGVCDVNHNPPINFYFQDVASGGQQYLLEVSDQPFTGPNSTNPDSKWAVKTLTGTGSSVNFQWSNSANAATTGSMDWGFANWQKPINNTSDDLIPVDGVQYFWRVKAKGSASNGFIDGPYIYNDGTSAGSLEVAINPVTAPVCKPLHDLSVQIDTTKWKGSVTQRLGNNTFQAGESVTVDVIVTNNGGLNYTALPQSADTGPNKLLWFYYSYEATPPPACPPTGSVPSGTVGIALPLGLTSDLGVGSSVTVAIPAFTPSVPGGTAYAVIAPNCFFSSESPIPGFDFNSGNNVSSGANYVVGVNKFFETKGGDVGANGTDKPTGISVGVNSVPLSIFQSDYLLGARGSISTAATKSTGYKISGYPTSKNFVLPGVYEYFRSKFRSKATQQACTISDGTTYNNGNKLYYCAQAVTIPSTGVTISGSGVFFIDGDLNVNGDLKLSTTGDNTAVYVVSGNINVDVGVSAMDGVFIAKKSFSDCLSTTGCAASNKLTITGSLYVDGADGGAGLILSRYYSIIGTNATAPVDSIVFQPKYIPLLANILTTSPVGWNEVAP